MMVKILLIGAFGRLGSRILAQKERFPEISIPFKVGSKRSSSPHDISPFLPEVDLVLDVSTPEALEENLPKILLSGKPLVIGSTGHREEQKESIYQASQTIPIFFSSNFSFGISLVKQFIRLLPKGDYSLSETHHRHKKDVPSGTALDLLALLPPETKIDSYRIGEATGTHALTLTLPHERITITHEALSRDVFAIGALKACSFLLKKPKGLYTTFYD